MRVSERRRERRGKKENAKHTDKSMVHVAVTHLG